jgi:hypothetical protein
MLALPAELELVNWSCQLLVMVALPPVMLIPVPVNVMPAPLLIVKLYADVPVKFQAPSVASTEMGILLLVLVAKVAVPAGAVAGVQFAAVV